MMKNLESDSAKYKPTFPKINRTPGAAMKSLYFLTNFNHIKLKFQDHQVLNITVDEIIYPLYSPLISG